MDLQQLKSRIKEAYAKSIHNDFHEYLLDVDFTEAQFRAEFGESAEYPRLPSEKSIAEVLKRH